MGPCGTPACNLRGAGGRDMCSLESPFSLNAELLLHLLNLFLAGISHIFWFRNQDGGTNSFTSFKERTLWSSHEVTEEVGGDFRLSK